MDELLMNNIFVYLMVWVIVSTTNYTTDDMLLALDYPGSRARTYITLSIMSVTATTRYADRESGSIRVTDAAYCFRIPAPNAARPLRAMAVEPDRGISDLPVR